jgi:ABC-2 type transport system permease protein
VPGSLVQLSLMSAGLAGFGVVFDARFGVLERLRVSPASRLALLLGRVLTNTVILVAQAVILVLAGFALGLRAPVAGVLVALVLVVLLATSLASLSYAVALTLPVQELFAPIMGTVLVPLLLLSGALIPMTAAPGWLNDASLATPFRYVVDAMRAAFAGHYTSTTLVAGLAVALVFTVVSLAVGTRTFVRENA